VEQHSEYAHHEGECDARDGADDRRHPEADQHHQAGRPDQGGDRIERPDLHQRNRNAQQQVAQDRPADRRERADEHRRDGGEAGGESRGRPDRAEQPDGQGVEGSDERLDAVENALQQHPDQCARRGDGQVPVAQQRPGNLVEQYIAQHPAAEPGGDADDRDAEQIEPSVAELRREQGALQAADAHGQEVGPERDADRLDGADNQVRRHSRSKSPG